MNKTLSVGRFTVAVAALLLAFGGHSAAAAGLKCDADVDNDIDNKDLALIAAARNTPASGPDDPRDADGDGMITVTDGRICALRCTLPDCSEPAANRAPTADAGPDQLVFTGSSVMLDGTGSTDPDGDALTFRWRFVERPAGSTAALSDPAAARPMFTADLAGRYVAELIVNDGKVDSAPDTVVVNTEDRNTDPVANAGPDQPGAFVGIEVTLDGSGSTDVDGDALAFSWAFVSRPAGSSAALTGAGTVSPRFTPDLRGVFVLRLTVNDGRGGTDTDDVVVSTENSDRPPVAVAGPDQSVEPGQNVCLDGSGSFDPDLDPISAYAWSFTTRPAGSAAVLAGAATATPCFTADRRGDFVVQLIVTANAVASVPDTVVVTTNNVRPVADAGADQTVTIGDTVNLDGTGSSDANGDALGFNWTFVSRPPGSSATLSGALTPFASFAADVAGPFVVQLIVNDGLLDSLPDTTLITVNALANNPPSAVNDAASTPEGVSVLIDVLANDSDPDSDPLTVTEVSDPAGGTTAIEANQVRFTPDAGFSGVTSFTYAISDGRGGTSSATVTVTVIAANRDPVANDDTAATPRDTAVDVNVTANDTDPDGDPLTVTAVGAPANGSASIVGASTVRYTPAADFAGEDSFSYTIGDGRGGEASATVRVTVEGTNRAPTANAGPDQDVFIVDTLRLDGSASSDPDGDPITYLWTVNTAPAGSSVGFAPNATDARPFVTVSQPGLYVFRLVVNDGTLDSAPADVAVQVRAVPSLAINSVTVTEGNSGTTDAVFTVSLSGPIDRVVTVDYATANGTATADSDFVAASGTVTFPAGSTAAQSITIKVNGDTDIEPNETFFVDLSGPVNATVSVSRGTGTILNDDFPPLALTPSTLSLTVGATGSLTVTLTAPAPVGGVTVNLASSDPEVATLPATATINAGSSSTSVTVTAGAKVGSTTITASAAGYTSDTSTVNVALRSMSVALAYPLVGVGRTIGGTVTLAADAPAGGVTVDLVSGDPTVATVAPASVFIAAGSRTAAFTVTGVAIGGASITASATGYASASTGVSVSNQVVNIGAVPTVGPGQSASLPISLSTPAVGDVVVSLAVADPSIATVSPATVTIPNGQVLPPVNPQVTGVVLGVTSVTAAAAGFAPETRPVTVALTLAFPATPPTITITAGTVENVPLTLSAPAVAGGFTVNLSSDDPAVASVPATITFPAGQTLVQVPVTGAGVGSTTIRASAPGVPEVAKAVQVISLGAVFVNGAATSTVNVGRDLQETFTVRLQNAPPSPVDITLTVTAGAGVLLTSDPLVAGATSLVVPGVNNTTNRTVYAQGTALGTATVTVTAPGYTASTLTVNVTPSGFAFFNIAADPTTVDAFAVNQAYRVYGIRLNDAGAFQTWQNTRGGATFNVPVTSSNAAAGVIVTSPLVFTGNTSFINADFDPVANGSTLLAITQPAGFTATTTANSNARTQFTVNVVGSSVLFNGSTSATLNVGRDLQETVTVRLQSAPPAPVDITLTAPAGVLLTSDPAAAGVGTLVIPAVNDATNRTVYVQGIALGTGTVTASAPGYAGSLTVNVTPSGFAFFNIAADPTTVDAFAANQNYRVYGIRLNDAGAFQTWQNTRGGATFNVPVTSSNAAAGVIVTSPLVFTGNTSFINAVFDPVATGSTLLAITQPAGFTATATANSNARTQFTVNVVGSAVLINGVANATTSIGRDLQDSVTVRLQSAPPAPVDITLTAPAGVLLSSDPAAAGVASLVIPAVNDTSNRTVYVQGIALGTAVVTATAPGYSGTLTANVTPSGFAFYATNDPETVDAFAVNQNFRVYGIRLNDAGVFQTWQSTRGGATFNVPVTSSNSAAGVIVTSPLVFTGGTSFVNAVFDPIAAGSTLLAVTQPAGFTATTTANFNARTQFTMNVVGSAVFINGAASSTTSVGRDLQDGISVRLQSAPPAPVDITLSAPAGSGVLLSTDPLVAGTETLVLPGVNNTTTRTVYVQSTSLGSTLVRASAPGYGDGTLTVNQTPSGFAFYATSDPETLPGTPDSYQVWAVRLDTFGAFATWQNIRGGVSFNVPVTSSNAAVGTITNSPLVFGPNSRFATAAFAPAGTGSTVVAVTQPAGFTATTTANFNARTQFSVNVTNVPAVVTLTVPDNTATEAGQTTGSFTLTRAGGNLAAALAVRVQLAGTASFSTDFNWSPGGSTVGGGIYQFSIPASQASLTVTITPTQDNLVEGAETVVVALSPSGVDPAAYSIGAPSEGTITIADDPPVVTLAVTDNTATEAGQTTGTFVLSRSGGNIASPLAVRAAVSGTASFSPDFNWSPGGSNLGGGIFQWSIPAGQASLTVTVTPALDNLVEGAETIVLDLSPSTATPPTYNIGAPNSGTITIADDPPVVTLTVTDATASENPLGTGAFVIARSGGNPGTVLSSIRVQISGTATLSTDYTLSSSFASVGGGIYQISLSSGEASRVITLTPVNDATPEVDETAIFTLSASTATPPGYQIGAPDGGTITIVSDEKPSGLPVAVPGPAPEPSPPAVSTASLASPAAAATPSTSLTKAELKRQQRNEKARQRAAQKEAKQLLKQSKRTGAATPSGVTVPRSSPGTTTSAVAPAATMPASPASARPPD